MNVALGITLYLTCSAALAAAVYGLSKYYDKHGADWALVVAAMLITTEITVVISLPISLYGSRDTDEQSIEAYHILTKHLAAIDTLEDKQLSLVTRVVLMEHIDKVNARIQSARRYNSGIGDAWSVDALGELKEIKW